MKSRLLVAGKSNESHLSLFFCLIERFEHTALGVSELRVVVVDDSMDLPEVEVIGAEPTQRLFHHFQSQLPAASRSADLGQEKNLVARTPDPSGQSARALAFATFPAA